LASIRVNVNAVQLSIPPINTYSAKLSTLNRNISGLTSGVDNRIQSRRGIGARIHQAAHSARELEADMRELEKFIEFAMEKYKAAEESVERKSRSLKKVHAESAVARALQLVYELYKGAGDVLDDSLEALEEQLILAVGFLTGAHQNALDLGEAVWGHMLDRTADRLAAIESGLITARNQVNDIRAGAEAAWDHAANFVSDRWNEAWESGTHYVDEKRRQMQTAYEFVKDNRKDLFNLLIEVGVREGLDSTPTGRVFREQMEYFQYEARDKMNGPHPSYTEVADPKNGWILLPTEMSIFHDDGKGAHELKYIHSDGREAVFDGDTHMPVTDARYKGTYNYINPTLKPEGFPSSLQDLNDWVEYGTTGLGHVITDVVPYYLVGQKNERDQQRFVD